jgi:hypothetical protein
MQDVYTYDPSQVKLMIAGVDAVGWDTISIKKSSPTYRLVKGINGKHTRIQDYDTSATIVLSVMQTSPTNDILSRVHELDVTNGTGRLEITLKDYSGDSEFSSVEAFIESYPEAKFSDSIQFNVWTIICQSTDGYVVGGNARPSENVISDILNRFDLI